MIDVLYEATERARRLLVDLEEMNKQFSDEAKGEIECVAAGEGLVLKTVDTLAEAREQVALFGVGDIVEEYEPTFDILCVKFDVEGWFYALTNIRRGVEALRELCEMDGEK